MPLPSDCLAAGTTGTTVSDVVPAKGELLRSTDGGHTWEVSTPAAGRGRVRPVLPVGRPVRHGGDDWFGCPAVGQAALQSIDAGTTFRSSPTSYVPLTLTSVDCPSTSGCIAVGGNTVARLTLLRPPRHTRRT